ncbi:response regulator [Clostridium gasigenes]|uniref:Stage 0 sporulation protein A homolog n=1 Tax=Clostridium gasigenes TaxID=94869 RepID=A0A1H0M1V3_9CLOT|nr:response regulator transcription factor [Clostridium gasigenes]MBB6713806.1 response regulator transcription factor [Clostridium gasigenes]MBU3087072.1 response regulator transcription factor [Clostridium gasigenes]MBU3105921.1 response regulator transcription factor [Clostridium gasigenes]MBU3131110.1 response regulator transcription factor [Clostridium gasigenes]SDO74334.1 DNA-binding response regulator, NarL/FixJ family, contains REC and HTH domains [Clostridium gasigenes]
MSENKIKLIIVDDHDLIREGLNRILSFEDDLVILGEGKNGKEGLELIKTLTPEIVLLDINMPEMNGIETLKKIKEYSKDIKVVMLTVENDRRTINEAIDIGADAYVLKESAGSEITNAIRLVHSGEKYIDKALVKIIFSDIKNNFNKEKSILDSLTDRELNILFEISTGLRNKEIAEKLFLSEKTIKNYVTNVFRKISVEDRVQATIFAINNNIEEYYYSKINKDTSRYFKINNRLD